MRQSDPPERCPRCEGYEATYHTFEGECSAAVRDDDGESVFARPPVDEVAARRLKAENRSERPE